MQTLLLRHARQEPARKEAVQDIDWLLIQQRLVVWLFCASVMGIIWSWTAIIVAVRTSGAVVTGCIACYLAFAWTAGFKAAEHMSWEPVLRRWSIWYLMRDYFQAQLIGTAPLPPDRRYVFAMAPHGITAVSGWLNFATDATGFSDAFPGIRMRALTLDANFRAPGIREYCLLHGLRSAGRTAIRNILGDGPGAAVLLVPGGAAEALMAAPGTMDTLIARRKGFVRMAVEMQADLVPIVAFGEDDLFSTYIPVRGSLVHRLLEALKRATGLAFPIFWGVGLTDGSWGLLPRGVPLRTVVGAPIAPPPLPPGGVSALSTEQLHDMVNTTHAVFLDAMQKLYDQHKDSYAPDRARDLCFVEQ